SGSSGLPGGISGRPGSGTPPSGPSSPGRLPGSGPGGSSSGPPSSRPGGPSSPSSSTDASRMPGGLGRTSSGQPPAARPTSPRRPGSSGGGTSSSSAQPGGISTGAATVTPKPKRQRQPRQAGDGLLSLDTRLDIIGVAMIVIALVSVLSFLSQEPGMLTRALLRFLYQGFGWGAYVVPLGVGAIGVWLIWRHFGDQLPPVDPVRIAGAVIAF